MSIAGRNRIQGSTVQVYRKTKLEGSGGQQAGAPVKLLADEPLRLETLTDELALRLFGEGERVERSAKIETWKGVEKGDLLVVTAGLHADSTKVLKVVATVPLFATPAQPLGRYQELGLAAT